MSTGTDRAEEATPTGGAYRSRVIASGAIALAMTAPGQTAAVSVFVDPLIDELGLSRTAVSTAYLIGSLSGALVMPMLGRIIDRHGPRRVMAAIAACFGLILVVSSAVGEVFGLTAAFVGIRVGGQGALNLVATTAVAVYVHRRRGTAMGVVSAVGTAGISLTPVLLERLIATWDFRTVWIAEGLAVWVLVVPAALLLLPRTPADPPAAGAAEGSGRERGQLPLVAWTLRQAMRTGMFWVVAGGVGACSLIATGLTFHQMSLLGERGLTPTQAAATFLPHTLAGLIATFALGWLADRFDDRLLIGATMGVLAGATVGAGWVAPGPSAVVYGMALGVCANGVRTLEAVAFPRSFGLRHLGAIRGVVHSVTVGASAFGPLLLAFGHDLAESYRPPLIALALLPIGVAVAAALTRSPPPVPPGTSVEASASEQPSPGRQ